jgi:hypothetical protein
MKIAQHLECWGSWVTQSFSPGFTLKAWSFQQLNDNLTVRLKDWESSLRHPSTKWLGYYQPSAAAGWAQDLDGGRAKKTNVARNDRSQPAAPTLFLAGSLSRVAFCFLIVAATVLIYANSLSGAFVFDDVTQIAELSSPHLGQYPYGVHERCLEFRTGTFAANIPHLITVLCSPPI